MGLYRTTVHEISDWGTSAESVKVRGEVCTAVLNTLKLLEHL